MNKQEFMEMEILLSDYENNKKELNELIQEQDALKLDLTLTKLELKYSENYQQYKTIKEKEERAVLETQDKNIELINITKKLNDKKLECEILKCEIDFLLKC